MKKEIKSSKKPINQLIKKTILNHKEYYGLPTISNIPKKAPNYSLSDKIIKSQLKNIQSMDHNNYQNLSNGQKDALNDLRTSTEFIIKPADKGLGITIMTIKIYNDLCMDHINKNDCYKRLESNPLETTRIKVVSMLHHLHDQNLISLEQHNQMIPSKESRLGILYGLPKLHKEKLSIRPIVSQIDHPTRNISKFLHEQLIDTAIHAPSYIKNSYELINLIEKLKYHKDIVILTCDIVSLYTNIPTKEGIKLATKSYQRHNIGNPDALNLTALEILLNNTLTGNVFSYNTDFYQQTDGTAMGTIMAPTYANCYLASKEKQIINSNNILLYKRYIDDILIIYKDQNGSIEAFKNELKEAYSPLELTIESSKHQAIFLDTTITVNHTKKRLDSSIYYKPIGKTEPIHIDSNHPEHIKFNTLTGNMLRINRLCSNSQDARSERIILHTKYLAKGYPINLTRRAIKRAIHHEPKTASEEEPSTSRIKLTHNSYTGHVKQAYHNIWREFEGPLTEKIKFSVGLNKSLKDSLVRTKALAIP